ncbi:hypothetical protein PILCRDRAFT_663421 [Piloderma croceum F 1598]|uniref:Uncharacterized protein n=1 Tax=Piloderma croceum (strain F 1598) TaxID=765440 RepID=A0A0C3APP6_PILCF|nr:hypothetical protein PILCRDRAFT_17105 [Piloderma croceum F 1598]KIM75888.1 hypothetical protein PILCRDRAFT_663421 [Piloderma croceum F 1598]
MDPNRPKNNRPDPNRVKSSSFPNVPRNPPNRTATGSFYDMRGSTFTSAGRDVVNNTYNGAAPRHTGDIYYQQPQPYPPFPPTGYPSPNTNPMSQWSGSDDSPTSSGYASPTTNPMPQWSGNLPSAATQPIPNTTPTTSAATTPGTQPPSAGIFSEPSTSDDIMNTNVPENAPE